MSQTRDNPPGYNSLVLPNDYEYKIDGTLAIGYTDGKLWDQSSIDQGLGAAKFSIVDKNNASKDISIRLEDHPEINDIGLNFCYEDSSLGTLKAYTYKEKSIMNSLRILENFGSDPNNSTHVLYEYISQIQSILSFITGTTSLGASLNKDDVKEAVFANISKFVGIVGFDNNYDFVEDNYLNGQTSIPATNTIRLNVNLSKLVPSLDEPFTIVLNFNESDESNLFTINIENLKINDQYGCFTINMINGYDKSNQEVIYNNLTINDFNNLIGDINNDSYIDLQDLPTLVKFGITTTKKSKYHIQGNIAINILLEIGTLIGGQDLLNRTYNVDIYIEIIDGISINNLRNVVCSIKIDDLISQNKPSTLVSVSSFKATSSEILIYKDDVFIKRTVKNYKKDWFKWVFQSGEVNYLKTNSTYFTNNILDWLVLFILNNQYIYNQVESNMDSEIKPFDLIGLFQNQSSNNRFYLKLNIPVLGGDLYLNYGSEIDGYPLNNIELNMGINGIATIKMNVSLDQNPSNNIFEESKTSTLNKINLFNECLPNYSYALNISDTANIKTYTMNNENDTVFLNSNNFSW